MPHYKDWHGRFSITQYPDNTDEHWGSFESAADVTNSATVVNWSAYESNNAPGAFTQALYGNFWDNYTIARPDAFAIMVDSTFTSATETDFNIWDVSWSGSVGDIASNISHKMTLAELTNVNSTPYSAIQSVYFQVEFTAPPVPEPSTGFLLGLAAAGSMMLRRVRRLLGFSVVTLFLLLLM
ncbi:MAG: PEP-CTERM sorting domain-containing protein [Pirellulales bacterium]|nr:PEP-CTERM sorting domain-containing protein [Pirellulales bacterium]